MRRTVIPFGYGRPPKRTQFQPGRSGNPKGRPRVLKNLAAVFDSALNERVTSVNSKGRRKEITFFEAVAKQVVRKAAGGDHRALRLVIDVWFRLHPDGKQEPSAFELMRRIAGEAESYLEKKEAESMLDKKIEETPVP